MDHRKQACRWILYMWITTIVPISRAGTVCSSGDPSLNLATHTIIVLLYSGRAVIVRVPTKLPLSSRVICGVMSGGVLNPTSEPFTLHLIVSAIRCWHLNVASALIGTSWVTGTSTKPTQISSINSVELWLGQRLSVN